MKARIEAENIERVRAELEALIQTVNKGNRASGEAIKSAASFGTEQRTLLRNQNLIINSWRLMHPQLSLLTRGLSNVATVGHVLTNAFQAINIMQLRQRESARDLTDATQKVTDAELIYQKALKQYGDKLHPEVMKAKDEFIGAQRDLINIQDKIKVDKWQDFGTQLGVIMSLFSIPANILNSIAAFKSLEIKDKFVTNLALVIASLKGLSLVQLGQIGVLITGIVFAIDKLATVITGESPLKKLAIDLGLVTATDTTRFEEIKNLIVDISKIEMDPFNKELQKTKQQLQDLLEFKRGLQEKSTTTKTTFLDDLFRQLGLPTDQDILNALTRFGIIAGSPFIPPAAGETGGNIPINPNVAGVPFGPPQRPPSLSIPSFTPSTFMSTMGMSSSFMSTIPANVIGQGGVTSQFRDISFGTPTPQISKTASINALGGATFTKSAGIQSDIDKANQAYAEAGRINQQINTLSQQLKESIPSLNQAFGEHAITLYRIRDEQSKRLAELQRQSQLKMGEYGNLIGKATQAKRDFQDLTGVSFTEWERMQQLAKQEGLDFNEFLALRSPAVAQRLGIQVGRTPDALSGLLNIPTGSLSFEEIGVLQQAGLLTGANLTNAINQVTSIQMATAANKELQGLRDIGVGGAFIQPGTFTVGIRSETAESKAAQTAAFLSRRRRTIPFASGGIINEPIIGTGLNTGAGYMFGESGPETITPRRGGGNGGVIVNIDKIIVEGNIATEQQFTTRVSENIARKVQAMIR